MTFLSIAVAGYAISLVALPETRNPFVAELFANKAFAAHAHMLGGAIALVTGAFQFNKTLRARYLAWHRRAGQVYVVAVLTGGVGSLMLAVEGSGGLVAKWGFGMMGVAWMYSTVMAWVKIRGKDVASHQVWMTRSFALTLSAVTLRFYLPGALSSGMSFSEVYPVIAWMAWVPNLLVVEWFLLRGARAS